jgi:cell division septation protein DedD
MRSSEGVRDIEQIQEDDHDTRGGRMATIAFVVLGTACVVFAAMAYGGKRAPSSPAKPDPLSELLAAQGKPASTSAQRGMDLSAGDVTFPGLLSDGDNPTTALAAVRPGATAPLSNDLPSPPPATDRLPVVPLPAQHVLQASPVVTRPRDALTKVAVDKSDISEARTPLSPAGREGGYQLQVSSFRTQKEASQFADQLRARGHKAYVLEANVSGRGTWYRVRIGPFSSQHAAVAYRSSFESKERVVPFVVPPAK